MHESREVRLPEQVVLSGQHARAEYSLAKESGKWHAARVTPPHLLGKLDLLGGV